MRYMLVDRVMAWEADASIQGVKNITMSEDFLELHFPRFPVMPGALIFEGLVQLAGWLEAAGSDFTQWILLEKVRSVRYYGFAFPGDQVVLNVEARGEEEGLKKFRGVASVEGERRVVAEFGGKVAPLADYEDPEEQRHHFRVLNREIQLSQAG